VVRAGVAGGSTGAGGGAPQAPDRPPAVVVPINGTQRLQMNTKKNISKVNNAKEQIATVSPILDDPTRVLITGKEPGITRVELTDVDNATETYDVVVQLDVEYLKAVLAKAIPTANVVPIPSANNTIILTGTVYRAEDADLVVRTAQSVVGDRVISNLRVGGVMQVEVCCTVALVDRNLFRNMNFRWLNTGQHHVIASSPTGAPFFNSTLGPLPLINSAVGQFNGGNDNLFLGLLSPNQGFFGFLQALRTEN